MKIALKKCRLVSDMQQKHKHRWEMEINIMLRLKHINVITALPVPEPLLAVQEHNLPMLAMEFCDKGDLRNVSTKPSRAFLSLRIFDSLSYVAIYIM